MLNLYLQRAGASGDIGLTLALQADHLLDSPVYEGEFALASFNPRALMALLDLRELDMASPQALTHVALSTRFAGDTEQVALNPLNIGLDETRIDGHVAVTDIERAALDVNLRVDRINVDHYLPPPSEEEEPATESEATGDEELIPLEMIRDLQADVQISLQQLQIMGMRFEIGRASCRERRALAGSDCA